MAASSARLPYSTPMPVGPNILWPENAKKSQSSARTSTRMCGTACAPSTSTSAGAVRLGDELGDGVHGAERVRDVRERDDLRPRAKQRPNVGIELTVVVDRRHAQPGAGLLADHLPRHDVGVVLEPGDQDFVAGVQRCRPSVAATRLMHSVVPRVNTISSRAARIDEVPNLLARAFERGGGALAQRVDSAVHVRMVQPLLERLGFEHGASALASTPRCRDTRAACRARAGGAPGNRRAGTRCRCSDAAAVDRPRLIARRSASVRSRAPTLSATCARQGSSRMRSITLAANAVRQHLARVVVVETARAQVEQVLGVELADGRAVAALDVVGVDLELGLRVDFGLLAEQQVVVRLPRVDALRASDGRRPCR